MQNGGQRNRQGGDMSQCVEICRTCAVTHPQSFLTCGFEAGIVALALRPQGVSPLKTQAFPVNGKSVVCWNGLIFRAAPVLLAVIPVFVVAGANTGSGLAEGAAEFLPGTIIVGGFSIFVHSQSSITDRITDRNRFRCFRAAWIEGNKCLALIDRFYRIGRCFSHRSPCRQGRRIPSKRSSDPRPRGSQRRRQNRRCCPAWSARRVAARRCSPPAHGFCSPSRTHTGVHCAGWRPSGRPRRSPGHFSGDFPWRTCFLQRISGCSASCSP